MLVDRFCLLHSVFAAALQVLSSLFVSHAPDTHVAHAGGAVRGLDYTNSREALDANYDAGFRVFEIDLSWTTDGELVLAHDWDTKWKSLFNGEGVPSRSEFVSARMKAGLTQLGIHGLFRWMEEHPDALVVTDAKANNLDVLKLIAQADLPIRSRIVPQVYDFGEYAVARGMGFSRVVLSVYRMSEDGETISRFVLRERPWALTAPLWRIMRGDFDELLQRSGTFIYAHTVNDASQWVALSEKGVDGIYTDSLVP